MVIAGFAGALRRLVLLLALLVVISAVPKALAAAGKTGTVGIDSFLPSKTLTASQLSKLDTVGGTSQERMNVVEALGRLSWPVDTSGLKIVLANDGELPPGMAALYTYPTNVISVRRSVADDPHGYDLPHVLAHEIGHMTEAVYMDDAARGEFLAARGFPADSDWQAQAVPWTRRPCEDFAEVFAALDVPSSSAPIATAPGRIKDPEQMRALVERYQPGPARRTYPLQLATLISVAHDAVSDLETQPLVLLGIFGLCTVYAVTGAVSAMEDDQCRARRRHTPQVAA